MTYLKTIGTFLCEILEPDGGWLGISNTGTEFIRLDLQVIEDADCTGELITWKGWLSDAAFKNSIGSLAKATGWDGNLATLVAGKSNLVGQHVQIVTEAETYQGKERIRIKWLNAPRKRVAPVESSKVEAMLKRMNDQAMAAAKSAKASIVEAKPVAALVVDADEDSQEVPF